MKIQSFGPQGPHQPNITMQTNSGIKPDVRARAVAILEGTNQPPPQEQSRQPENHSIDPNNISPEEVSAVRQPSQDKGVNLEPEVTTEPQEDKKVDPGVSRQFAILAKQEKQLRLKQQQQLQAFKTREAELTAREAALIQKPQIDPNQYISKDELKRNTLRQLADAGITYEELTQQILNTSPTDPRTEAIIAKQSQELSDLRARLDAQDKSQVEGQQQARQAAVRQITRDVKDLITMDPAFETIKATNSISDVVELIERTFDKDGYVLSVEEASQQVENYLMEEALKLTRIGKIKSRLEEAAQSNQSKKNSSPQQTQQSSMKTLTNATSSSRQLSARERALLAFKGELKS